MRRCGFKQGNTFDILTTVLPLHWQLRGCRLLASIVRATSERLNIRAGVDVAACAISRIVDPADLDIATSVFIDRDTARSWNKNLNDERVHIS